MLNQHTDSVQALHITPPANRTESHLDLDEWRRQHTPNILGNDPKLMDVFRMIERVADTDCSILVSGESGTGKELIARAVHDASNRTEGPFIAVNCAAIPDNLLESELFGHARGAFTGATGARVGQFTAAHGGTLFLDEIGELPLALQAKLLRVLQEKHVQPVGESKGHDVDIRVITATNRDLESMVQEGTFREDLLYRLNVIPIELPALRERRNDIPELVGHFVMRTNEKRNRAITGVTAAAMAQLCNHAWPGNIRQLENVIERMVILRTQGHLDVCDLPARLQENGVPRTEQATTLPNNGIDLKDAVEQFENNLILQALERTGWNKNQAANILHMNRTTLVEKLKKKNLAMPLATAC